MSATARIDMKLDPETKLLAERAASACGQTVSAYILTLIKTNAPKVLEEQRQLTLKQDEFDAFMRACDAENATDWQISDTMKQHAKRLDKQGVAWR